MIAAGVLAGHGLLVIGLVAAFAPDLGRQVVAVGLAAVAFTTPPPVPPPPPPPKSASHVMRAARPEAASGTSGRRAEAAPIAVPPPMIVVAPPVPAAPVAGPGVAVTAGAAGVDDGSGAGSGGNGTGTGAAGAGGGGGRGGEAVKIGGGIDLVRDFDPATQVLRRGDYVVIELTVGRDGVPTACRIARPSSDAAANATTCALAQARFRFRPATDAGGHVVVGTYGWKQVWRR